MPPEPAGTSRNEIEAKLKQLRDFPVDTAGSQDRDMLPLHASLMCVKPGTDGILHWFCPLAESATRELATFLLRLHAYNNEKVDEWRKRLKRVWRGCADCIRCMDQAKSSSRTTYFGAFSDVIISRFWVNFEDFEVKAIIEALTAANITPNSGKSLADVSSPVLYHILSKPAAFSDPFILGVISAQPFLPRTVDWPMEPPPPGYFLLVVHEDKDIRDWAAEHIAKAKPIPPESFGANYDPVLRILLSRIAGKDHVNAPGDSGMLSPLAAKIDGAYRFAGSQTDIWAGFCSMLRLIPGDIYESFGIHRAVIGHLHDNGPHFREILRCMLQAIKTLGNKLWSGESGDYPQVVFDAIKDNQSYIDLVLAHDAQRERPWFLLFFLDYFRTVWNMPIFDDIFAKFAAFTCSDLQHERFKGKRPFVTMAALQVLCAALTKAYKSKSASRQHAILDVVDIHYDFIVSVSFSEEFDGSHWVMARTQALALIRLILSSNIEQLSNAVIGLSALNPATSAEEVKKFILSVRRQVWRKVYEGITWKDTEGLSLLLDLASRTAKFDKLHKNAISRSIWKYYDAKKTKPPQDLLEAVNSAVDSVNSLLTVIRDGFLDTMTKFANHNLSSALNDTIHLKDLAKHLIAMMLSPVEALHNAGQTLVGQAYDADVRADCFREILKAEPVSSFNGLYNYITYFNSYASQVTEACDSSKALVRCMTDVLEVLGNSPDGLLRDRKYVKRNVTENSSLNKKLPELWKAMATSVAVIFRRTPKWAAYFSNDTMVEWMRDALIFARDLLDHRKAFEAASIVNADEGLLDSPRKLSPIGKRMVEDLQDVLLELLAWLRLTDTELLYQSFALLKSLFQCFRSVDVKPSPDALAKLTKFIEQNKSSNDSKRISFLSKSDLVELEVAIADFTKEDEDEAELISVSWKSKEKRKSTDGISSSPEVEEVDEPIRKRPKTNRPMLDISLIARKHTKQTKLSFADKSSAKSLVGKSQKLDTKSAKPAAESVTRVPVSRTSIRREPKFEGSYRPQSESSRPATPSSSSSSSETEDEDEDAIAYIKRQPKKPSPKKERKRPVQRPIERPVERSKVKLIEDPGLIQARREAEERMRKQEEARRIASRLKPDVTSLHYEILSWNYDYEGSFPPMDLQQLNRVPDSFTDDKEYLRIFRPLLLLEAWSQIVKSKEETTTEETVLMEIASRAFEPPWLHLEANVVSKVAPEWRLIPEVDIVLLRHLSGKPSLMGKVTNFRKTDGGFHFDVTCCTRALNADPGLIIGSKWNLSRVFSLATLNREYGALISLRYYDMVDTILRPSLSDPIAASPQEVRQVMEAYRVNEPQAKAIISAMKTNGFSLIQGPPGTGKTWTICGLVGAFLSSRGNIGRRIAVPGTATQSNMSSVRKVLVCAPSNAAVDEITKRLAKGVYSSRGELLTPKVVRVGTEAQITFSTKEFSLDSLVEARVNETGYATSGIGKGAQSLHEEIEKVKTTKQEKMKELQSIANNATRTLSLQNEIAELNERRASLSQRLDRLQDKMRSQTRANDAQRRRLRYDILSEADVICTTLSGSGHEQLEPFDFSMVIIDEASQSIELSSLIPLKYQCTKCVMVGDPQQLPPTVLSPEASKWGYDQSLFVRMQKHRPNAVHLLSIQYRMHPQISLLPSKVFYGGRLQDGPDMDKKTSQPWHVDPRFGPYRFYSVEYGHEEPGRVGHSLLNREECRTILFFYEQLRRQFPSIDFDDRVGIVCMYRSQMQEMRNMFRKRFGPEILRRIDFNTVDGFQGQEKDIIILSCVRAGPGLTTVGFLSDIRRMNVAITRSKSSLFIFGHATTLQRSDKVWKDIIDDARSRSCFVELTNVTYFLGNSTNDAQANGDETKQSVSQNRASSSKAQKKAQAEEKAQVQVPPGEELFSPKRPKAHIPRKLPQEVKPLNGAGASNATTMSSSLKTEPRRDEREEMDSRLQPNEKHGKPLDTNPSPSVASQQSTPSTVSRPPKLNEPDAAAMRELEAFRRRKKEAANPLLKRLTR